MRRRALVGTVATLGLMALVGLFASLSLLFSSPIPAYAQGTNNPPEFSAETATREVAENTEAFHNIGDPVEATDTDANDRLVYTLENAHTSPFTIIRATGQLQVGTPLDHEDEDTYEVTVVVTDSEGAKDTITVTINVNDVEEPGKVSLSWTQPQPDPDSEVEASLTDPDGIVSSQTWKWQISTDRNTWSDISGETSSTYTPETGDVNKRLRAVASYTDPWGSGKTAQSEAAYVKQVPDSNQTPDFKVNTDGGYSCTGYSNENADACVHIRRYAPPGSSIYYPGYVHITDHDQVRYSLGGVDATLFRLDPVSGTLFTTEAHAYNNANRFEITITATDPSGLSDYITVALRPSGGADNPVVQGPKLKPR